MNPHRRILSLCLKRQDEKTRWVEWVRDIWPPSARQPIFLRRKELLDYGLQFFKLSWCRVFFYLISPSASDTKFGLMEVKSKPDCAISLEAERLGNDTQFGTEVWCNARRHRILGLWQNPQAIESCNQTLYQATWASSEAAGKDSPDRNPRI